jgi:3-hydroxyisobutyrate dehydrogenase
MMEQTVGVIGLGAMGLPLARRLARAGFRLMAFDTSRRAVEALAAEGAEAASEPGDLVAASDILLTCLPNPQAVEAVYAEVAKQGLLACDCSTVGPGLAIRLHDELAARGVRYVECPMFGAPAQAASGELFLVLSGDQAAVGPKCGSISGRREPWLPSGKESIAIHGQQAVRTIRIGRAD